MPAPAYLQYLKQHESLTLNSGEACEVWELDVPADEVCLKDWAWRFRQTYCLDSDIDILRDGTGKTRAEYLIDLVFPDKTIAPGPGVRSGDFAELLVSDFVEFMLGYWVPRTKYAEKSVRNESVKGVDIDGLPPFRIPPRWRTQAPSCRVAGIAASKMPADLSETSHEASDPRDCMK